MKQLDATTVKAIEAAVAELERCSCAEVVVEVRGRSGSYAQADVRFASLLAFLALLVLLFSPWPFRTAWVAIDVALMWLIGVFAARRSDSVRRLMTSDRERATQVRTLAASVFHERGVANTGAETGLLLYLSLLERKLELLADRGVLSGVPSLEWNRIAAAARTGNATVTTLLAALAELRPLLERHMPVREGDVDELCNTPRFVSE
jgi:putative membrane protein